MELDEIFAYMPFVALVVIIPLSLAWKGLLTKDEESTTWLNLLKVAIYIIVAMLAVIGLFWVVVLLIFLISNEPLRVW